MDESRFRLRVTYRKTGMLRFLSHLETARACERAIRRAGLPYAVTHGFNPHMRIAFGPALPVGTAGLAEMYDLWLTAHVPAERVLAALAAVTREELAPVEARYVDPKAPSLAASAVVAHYEVTVTGSAEVAERIEAGVERIVGSGTLRVEHKGKEKVFVLAEA
ncbi:MAG: TIGR03936 family radical SAM-associated protein, partial [Coriobacteriia bacterium]|nr:TIGR03936 family radical SAM-associated protein [Coriobacteriia bacterium]